MRQATKKEQSYEKRKIRIFQALLLFILWMTVVGVPVSAGSTAKTYRKAVSFYKKGNYKAARKNFKKLNGFARESCIRKMHPDMKKAYLKTVKRFRNHGKIFGGYYLTDINKDKKPELIIDGGICEADRCIYVYTCNKGKVKKLGKLWSGHSSYYYDPRGNGMIRHFGHMGYEHISTIKIVHGKLTERWWSKEERSVTAYIDLPYELDSHIKYTFDGIGLIECKELGGSVLPLY